MSLTKTHARDDTTMRCSLDWMLWFFCNIFSRWVLQKHTHGMTRRCAALSIEGFVLLSCKMGLKTTHARNDTTMRCSLDWRLCSFVTYLQDESYKNTRTRWHYDALLYRLNALFFCHIFARLVLQKHTHAMTRRCVKRGSKSCRILRNVRMAWATLSSFGCNPPGVIVPKTRQSLVRRYVVWNVVEFSEQ
jgi:hypothetical protein